MSTIYELEFPCGCHTQNHDPREWVLCEQHPNANAAMVDWANEGARLWQLLHEIQLPPRGLAERASEPRFLGKRGRGGTTG